MRYRPLAGVLCGLLLANFAQAQTYPAEMTIVAPEVEVRSGPSMNFYATSKLYRGARVKVLGEEPKQPGWLRIAPPYGSFSWINERYVIVRPNGRDAYVDSESPVPVLPGSSLTSKAPDVEQVKLSKGALVVIVDRPERTPTATWLPIAPPPQEVRYIPATAVDTKQVAATTPANNPPPVNGRLASMTKPAPAPVQQPAASGTYVGGWQPGSTPQPAPTTALYATGPSQAPVTPLSAPQWTLPGTLRKTAYRTDDGRDMFVLVNRQGQPVVYVACQPGFSLRSYLNRTVSLYGAISYNSSNRIHSMTASHVATY